MKEENMRQMEPDDEELGRIHPDELLITKYLINGLSPDERVQFEARLETDDDFYERAWPAIQVWQAIPSHSDAPVTEINDPDYAAQPMPGVSEADVRRYFELFCKKVGLTIQGAPIPPTVDGAPAQPTGIPNLAPVPPGVRPATVIPKVVPVRRPWRERVPSYAWRARYYVTAAAACAIALISAVVRFGGPGASVAPVAEVTPVPPIAPVVKAAPGAAITPDPTVAAVKPVKPSAPVAPVAPVTSVTTDTPIPQVAGGPPTMDPNLVDNFVQEVATGRANIPQPPLAGPQPPKPPPLIAELVYPARPERRVFDLPFGGQMTLEAGSWALVTWVDLPNPAPRVDNRFYHERVKMLFVVLSGEAGFDLPTDTASVTTRVETAPGFFTAYRGGRFALRASSDSSELLVSVATGFSRARSADAEVEQSLMIPPGQFARIPRTGKGELTRGEGYPVPPKPTAPPPPPSPPPAPVPPGPHPIFGDLRTGQPERRP